MADFFRAITLNIINIASILGVTKYFVEVENSGFGVQAASVTKIFSYTFHCLV